MTPWPKFDDPVVIEPQTLTSWLNTATEDLAATPRERIKREIESHFAEAVAAYTADGQSEYSARSTALADLGDPDEAAKKFRKSHLTETEAKWLRSMVQTASRPLFSVSALKYDAPYLAGVILLFYLPRWTDRYAAFFPFFSWLCIGYAGLRLAPRYLYANVSAESFRKIIGLSEGLTVIACILVTGFVPQQSWFGAYCILLFVCFRGPGLRIWRKLRKMPDPWLNSPPQKPAST